MEGTMEGHDATKGRLLQAAGEEFAEKGFECARIRAICDRAQANIAAVNYHLGDKEQLYVQASWRLIAAASRPERKAVTIRVSPRNCSAGSSAISSAGSCRCTTRTTGGIAW